MIYEKIRFRTGQRGGTLRPYLSMIIDHGDDDDDGDGDHDDHDNYDHFHDFNDL